MFLVLLNCQGLSNVHNIAAGGFPGWLSNTAATARSNETEFVDAWQLYVQQFAETTSKYQYPDGPVIGIFSSFACKIAV